MRKQWQRRLRKRAWLSVQVDIAVANAGIGQAAGDGSEQFYGAMAERNAELAEKGSSSIFVDQLIHMEDRGWGSVMDVNVGGAFRLARRVCARTCPRR